MLKQNHNKPHKIRRDIFQLLAARLPLQHQIVTCLLGMHRDRSFTQSSSGLGHLLGVSWNIQVRYRGLLVTRGLLLQMRLDWPASLCSVLARPLQEFALLWSPKSEVAWTVPCTTYQWWRLSTAFCGSSQPRQLVPPGLLSHPAERQCGNNKVGSIAFLNVHMNYQFRIKQLLFTQFLAKTSFSSKMTQLFPTRKLSKVWQVNYSLRPAVLPIEYGAHLFLVEKKQKRLQYHYCSKTWALYLTHTLK